MFRHTSTGALRCLIPRKNMRIFLNAKKICRKGSRYNLIVAFIWPKYIPYIIYRMNREHLHRFQIHVIFGGILLLSSAEIHDQMLESGQMMNYVMMLTCFLSTTLLLRFYT